MRSARNMWDARVVVAALLEAGDDQFTDGGEPIGRFPAQGSLGYDPAWPEFYGPLSEDMRDWSGHRDVRDMMVL